MLLEKLIIPIGFDTGLLLEGIHAIEGLITGAIDRTREWAEDLDKLGDVTGMSSDKLAAWQFITQKAGVSSDKFTQGLVILEKGLVKADGTLDVTGKKLEEFGVNVKDANGKVKDQSTLMNDISKKYASFSTQQERVNFLTEIFGRSGASLVDVFDTLAKEGGIDAVTAKVQALGLVLDPTQYEQFQRGLNEVNLTFTGLANAFAGPLLPGAQKILDIFIQWLQSPWVADEIKNIGDKLGTLVNDIAAGLASGDWSQLWGDINAFLPNLDPVALTQKFKDWVASVDWFSLSTDFANGMNQVDWAGGTRKAIDASVNILQALIDLINRTNWAGLGEAFKNAITGVLRDGMGRALVEAWLPAVQGFWTYVENLIMRIKSAISDALQINTSSSTYMPPGRASGGSGNGMTWVGERGPELVNLPSGSYVNNNQASSNMGIDYYLFASILAVELAKVTN